MESNQPGQSATGASSGGLDGKSQRDALEKAQEAATERQPETFRDEANADKVVDIGEDKTRDPIKGIDPAEGKGR